MFYDSMIGSMKNLNFIMKLGYFNFRKFLMTFVG